MKGEKRSPWKSGKDTRREKQRRTIDKEGTGRQEGHYGTYNDRVQDRIGRIY